jgi:hypothetical protein
LKEKNRKGWIEEREREREREKTFPSILVVSGKKKQFLDNT